MTLRRVVSYEPTCDECFTPADEYMSRKEAAADLKKDGYLYKAGWRKHGAKLACPTCANASSHKKGVDRG